MSLQRYDMIVSQSGNHMQKKEDGDWVDAEEAQAEIDRLTEKVKNLEAVMMKRQNDAAATSERVLIVIEANAVNRSTVGAK